MTVDARCRWRVLQTAHGGVANPHRIAAALGQTIARPADGQPNTGSSHRATRSRRRLQNRRRSRIHRMQFSEPAASPAYGRVDRPVPGRATDPGGHGQFARPARNRAARRARCGCGRLFEDRARAARENQAASVHFEISQFSPPAKSGWRSPCRRFGGCGLELDEVFGGLGSRVSAFGAWRPGVNPPRCNLGQPRTGRRRGQANEFLPALT